MFVVILESTLQSLCLNNFHYLHFSDYCPHLCRYVYHDVSTVVCSGLLQVIGMSNLTLYFVYRGRLFLFHELCFMDASYQLSPVNFLSESSLLPSPGIELTLFGYIIGSKQRLCVLKVMRWLDPVTDVSSPVWWKAIINISNLMVKTLNLNLLNFP